MNFRSLLKSVTNYAIFFLTVSFAVSCCMMLFVSTLAETMSLELNHENIAAAAKLTLGNVFLITLIFCVVDYFRRRISVGVPVRMIIRAAERITEGDFSARVAPIRGAGVEEFNQIADAINKMAEELSGIETLRTDFIANVSHELKTPLAVIGNYATMLQRPGISSEEKAEYAGAISQASRNLAQLITNILKLSKLENQQIFPKMDRVNVGEQLCRSILDFEDMWEKKAIEIDADIQENLFIRTDGELLSLVWNNLISNAIKFTPEGGKVTVTLTSDHDFVEVAIKDTGCGMTTETGRHIFEKFYQGDTSHATQGNGLGLALVKRVVDILNGEISVESIYGNGSTFTVRLKR